MRRIAFIISLIILFSSVSAEAQNRRRKAQKKQKEEVEEVVEDPRVTMMKQSVQQIMFIDSIVVDKKHFFKHYMLSPEMGSFYTSKEFWNDFKSPDDFVYLNQFKDKCYFARKGYDNLYNLYASDLHGDDWCIPYELKGIADTARYMHINHPYMMSDGKTFYFSATGNESIGGYDIFITRYDSEEGRFLNAENIGMPFNSTANDYLYAIDDYCNLGWFATDRNQPQDKVCIYIFVPSEVRSIYNSNRYTAGEIERYANIHRISSTWGNGKKRKQALDRLNKIIENEKAKNAEIMYFVINDEVIYTSVNEFKNKDNIEKYNQLRKLYSKYNTIEKTLTLTRDYYPKASEDEKEELELTIANNENEYYQLEKDIKKLEKEIRNSENSFVK